MRTTKVLTASVMILSASASAEIVGIPVNHRSNIGNLYDIIEYNGDIDFLDLGDENFNVSGNADLLNFEGSATGAFFKDPTSMLTDSSGQVTAGGGSSTATPSLVPSDIPSSRSSPPEADQRSPSA